MNKYNMSSKEKLIFISSFIWFLHWGSCIIYNIVDMVITKQPVRILLTGL